MEENIIFSPNNNIRYWSLKGKARKRESSLSISEIEKNKLSITMSANIVAISKGIHQY